jgi:hypothetical protein
VDKALGHDCAVAAAVLLLDLFGQGGAPADLFSQAARIVEEAIASYHEQAVRPALTPSEN